MANAFIAAVFYEIPEGIIAAFAGLGLLGIKQPRRRIFLLGLVFGVTIPIVRNIGLPFGVHTLVLLPIFMVLSRAILKTSYVTGLGACMLGFFLIALGEFTAQPLMRKVGLDPKTILENPIHHVVWGWASAFLLVFSAIIATTTRFSLITAPEAKKSNMQR